MVDNILRKGINIEDFHAMFKSYVDTDPDLLLRMMEAVHDKSFESRYG